MQNLLRVPSVVQQVLRRVEAVRPWLTVNSAKKECIVIDTKARATPSSEFPHIMTLRLRGGPVEKKVEANGSEGALFSRVTVTS